MKKTELEKLIESGEVQVNEFRIENEKVVLSFISKNDEIDKQLESVELSAEYEEVVELLASELEVEVRFKENYFEGLMTWEVDSEYGSYEMTDWSRLENYEIWSAVLTLSK